MDRLKGIIRAIQLNPSAGGTVSVGLRGKLRCIRLYSQSIAAASMFVGVTVNGGNESAIPMCHSGSGLFCQESNPGVSCYIDRVTWVAVAGVVNAATLVLCVEPEV